MAKPCEQDDSDAPKSKHQDKRSVLGMGSIWQIRSCDVWADPSAHIRECTSGIYVGREEWDRAVSILSCLTVSTFPSGVELSGPN